MILSEVLSVNAHDSATFPFQQQKNNVFIKECSHRIAKPHALIQSIHEGPNLHHVQLPVGAHLSATSTQINYQNSPSLSKPMMALQSASPTFQTAVPALFTLSSSSLDAEERHASFVRPNSIFWK